jgi:hypothetical protein
MAGRFEIPVSLSVVAASCVSASVVAAVRSAADRRPPRPPRKTGIGVSVSPSAIRSIACTKGTMRARSHMVTIAATTTTPTSVPPATAAASRFA